MTSLFVWVVFVILGISTLGKLYWLARGHAPPRVLWQEAIDVAIQGAVVAWAVVLLLRS
jgi:hypothetical protein